MTKSFKVTKISPISTDPNKFRIGLTSDGELVQTPFGMSASNAAYCIFVVGEPTCEIGSEIELEMAQYSTYTDSRGFTVLSPAN